MRRERIASFGQLIGRARPKRFQMLHKRRKVSIRYSLGQVNSSTCPVEPTRGGIQRNRIRRGRTLPAQGQNTLLDRLWHSTKVRHLARSPQISLDKKAIVEAPTIQLVERDQRAVRALHCPCKILATLRHATRPGRRSGGSPEELQSAERVAIPLAHAALRMRICKRHGAGDRLRNSSASRRA